jgi:hypothetical protein
MTPPLEAARTVPTEKYCHNEVDHIGWRYAFAINRWIQSSDDQNFFPSHQKFDLHDFRKFQVRRLS